MHSLINYKYFFVFCGELRGVYLISENFEDYFVYRSGKCRWIYRLHRLHRKSTLQVYSKKILSKICLDILKKVLFIGNLYKINSLLSYLQKKKKNLIMLKNRTRRNTDTPVARLSFTPKSFLTLVSLLFIQNQYKYTVFFKSVHYQFTVEHSLSWKMVSAEKVPASTPVKVPSISS